MKALLWATFLVGGTALLPQYAHFTARHVRRAAVAMSSSATSITATDATLYASLQKRAAAVNDGAGKRYRVESLVGFLNVHTDPGDPWRTDNVVGRLPHGAVVESNKVDGVWVSHDGGGWSIRLYDGHEFLVPID